LIDATDRIVGELNSAITSTILPITSLAPQVSALQSSLGGTGTKPTIQDPGLFNITVPADPAAADAYFHANKIPTEVATVALTWAEFKSRAEDLIAAEKDLDLPTADFSGCTLGVVQVSAVSPLGPLALSASAAALSTAQPTASIQINGGRAPFQFKFTGSPANAPASSVDAIGSAFVLSFSKSSTTAAGTYPGVLGDAAGAATAVTVTVK
jgi:hypothetical protein